MNLHAVTVNMTYLCQRKPESDFEAQFESAIQIEFEIYALTKPYYHMSNLSIVPLHIQCIKEFTIKTTL